MELILILAVIAGIFVLRRQGQRLNALESELASLRARLGTAVPVEALAAEGPLPVATDDVALDPPGEATTRPEDFRANEESLGETATTETSDEEDDHEPVMVGPWQQAARATTVPEAAFEPAPRRDIETALGTRWAVWVGGLALALGGVFLIRQAIESGFFGPGMRLAAAALFGIALGIVGEVARRRGFRAPVGGLDGAYVPAILTAAAAFTLFAAVFAAYGIYGFIGTVPAFVLLGGLALATIALALVHGQALAGLGLLCSYLTPVLVSSQSPSPWTLFLYLSIVLVAAIAIASIRRWRFLAGAAYVGGGFWTLLYFAEAPSVLGAPVAVLQLAGIAVLGALWHRRAPDGDMPGLDGASLLAALFAALAAAALAVGGGNMAGQEAWGAAILVAMLAVAAWQAGAAPLLHAAGLALLVVAGRDVLGGSFDLDFYYGRFDVGIVLPQSGMGAFQPYAVGIAALLLAAGVALARLLAATAPVRSASWALWAALAPFCVMVMTWLSSGNLDIDWRFAAVAYGLAAILAASAEIVARAEDPAHAGGWAVTFLAAGAAASLAFALLAGFGPLTTTILTGLASAVPAAATRLRAWPVLGWLSVAFGVVTLARFGIDPTLVGAEALSPRPVLNQLLPGYLLPAAALAYAAWQLAQTGGLRPRMALEALATITALVGAAMLVRHAMNGGVIADGAPTLAEQAIYSLLLIGAGGVLMTLDRRSPSLVFFWGSIAAGVVSVGSIVLAHLFALNPLVTGESTGRIVFFNLLLLAYLIPAAALAALAWRARGRRPDWYVSMLACAAAALAFAYVTLSVRRWFQGEFIATWKGFGAVETYTYSAVWLALGVAILVAGIRLGSRTLRLASAVLVVVAVAKVFLYDMRELEGVLRALSFIGLGGVLIGIGMFYQRMLVAAAVREETAIRPAP